QNAVAVANSTYPTPSGCNAQITSTQFNASWDHFTWFAVAVGYCDASANSARMAVTLGDGNPDHGNTFEDMGGHDGKTSAAVNAGSCTSSLEVHANLFDKGEAGIILWPPQEHVSITGNRFIMQGAGGILVKGQAILND